MYKCSARVFMSLNSSGYRNARRIVVNKNLKILLNVTILLTLIACTEKSISSDSLDNCSSTEETEISSSIEEMTSSIDLIDSSNETSSSSSLPEEIYYHVIFINYDDTLLYEVDVKEGEEAIYNGIDPTKEEDDEFTYEFDGWDIDLTNITSDVTAKATYKAIAKENWGPIIWF